MIEIVFGENAYSSLRVAQGYGKGKYRGGAVSVFIRNTDGTKPTAEEIQEAHLRAEEETRQDWENAVPLDSKREDVYCFDVALSVGDNGENTFRCKKKSAQHFFLLVQ